MTPAVVQQVQLTEAIIELVKAGLGVAVLARWAVRPYVEAGTLAALRLTRKGYRRQWGAVVLRDMAEVGFVKDFIELVARRSPASEAAGRRHRLLQFDSPLRVPVAR